MKDHPIFIKSIAHINNHLGVTGLDPLQQKVLERIIHSSGDFGLTELLRFSANACEIGIKAIQAGGSILTDTQMAAAGIKPMASKTLKTEVKCILDWAPKTSTKDSTRSGIGMQRAWNEISNDHKKYISTIVIIGSSPTALEVLLDEIAKSSKKPSLVVGMPVGFIGVQESKKRLSSSNLNYILLQGSRGGAGIAASVANALLRASEIIN